jgi:hypothetical protein
MSQKKVKQHRRIARKMRELHVAEAIEATLQEPWTKRLQTAAYIASGGSMWTARIVVWSVIAVTAWNVYQVLYAG